MCIQYVIVCVSGLLWNKNTAFCSFSHSFVDSVAMVTTTLVIESTSVFAQFTRADTNRCVPRRWQFPTVWLWIRVQTDPSVAESRDRKCWGKHNQQQLIYRFLSSFQVPPAELICLKNWTEVCLVSPDLVPFFEIALRSGRLLVFRVCRLTRSRGR